jgi:type I site-specific restriction endonuclease
VLIDQTMVNDSPVRPAMASLDQRQDHRAAGRHREDLPWHSTRSAASTPPRVYLGSSGDHRPGGAPEAHREFSPGFDLIVIDECHRGSA